MRRLRWLLYVMIFVEAVNDAIKAKDKFGSTRDLRVARTFAVSSRGGIARPTMPAKPKNEVSDGRPACISTVFIRDIRRRWILTLSRRGAVVRSLVYLSNQKR